MIFCSWNIRGWNYPYKQEELKSFLLKKKISFLLKKKIDLLGFLGTKIKQRRADKVKKFLGAEWTCFTDQKVFKKKTCFTDYSLEPNGMIWLCWRHQLVGVTILISNPQLMHCQVEEKDSRFSCNLTFFLATKPKLKGRINGSN